MDWRPGAARPRTARSAARRVVAAPELPVPPQAALDPVQADSAERSMRVGGALTTRAWTRRRWPAPLS